MVIILEKPNFPPYVCITCGKGTGRRWFVSLDFPLDNYFNPVNEGIIFQCNECWESLATKVAKLAQVYVIGQVPWEEGEYVEPTYSNENELLTEVAFSGPGISDPTVPVAYLVTPGDSETTSSSDSTTEPTTTDDEAGPVQEFRDFFGDTGGNSSE